MAELVELTLTEMLRQNSREAHADGVRAGRAAALEEAVKAISELYKSFTSHQSKTALITARNSLRALIEESP